jgi:glycosyltransferase involved in cell wall biosynthesis
LRLAVVSPFIDRRHGTERALAELLDRLANKYGCEIQLFAQSVSDLSVADPTMARAPGAGAILWHRVPVIPGPHIVRFLGWMLLNGLLRWWHYSFRGASFDIVLSPGINCFHADVILVHALFCRLRELSGDPALEGSRQSGGLRDLHRKAYYALVTVLERRAYSNRNVSLVAVSPRTQSLLESYFHRSDAIVALNGVDTTQFSASARAARRAEARATRKILDDDFVLLLIGNDWRVKGVPTILEAMAALPDLKLQLIVVGADDTAPFVDAADRLGVLSRCTWEKPPADVVELYAAADVYVSPSLEDSFGLPAAEAMACGLPAITSVFAGVASQIQHEADGFVLRDPHDAQALARILQQLQADPDIVRRIGSAAAKKAQAWTWDRNAAAIWDVLTRIAADRDRQRQRGNLA